MQELTYDSRFIGAFTGFVVGDAFGYPCRDLSYEELCSKFEKTGCLQLPVSIENDSAVFSDATQLMLFTADGITWASYLNSNNSGGVNYTEYVFYAYQYWLYTQTKTIAGNEYSWLFNKTSNPYKSKLIKTKGIYKKRFSNPVNVDALLEAKNLNYGKINAHLNNNSDSGGVKRVLPAGLYFNYDTELAFRAGTDFAAITHGNTTAHLAAGCYSAIVAELINGNSIDGAIEKVIEILKTYNGFADCFKTLELVKELLKDEKVAPMDAVREIGAGQRVDEVPGAVQRADEVLGVAIFCAALFEDSFENAIRLAVNHDGESDACGALCGGLLGAYHGAEFVPKKWVKKLPYLRLIEDMALDLVEQSYFNEEDEGEGDED